MRREQDRIVVIGAGVNGLVTAFYLARARLKPLVLERRENVGGAVITDDIYPGFKCSTLAHTFVPLRADVERDLRLERHGLRLIRPDVRVFAPTPDGRALVLHDDIEKTAQEIARLSQTDGQNYAELHRVLGRLGNVLNQLLMMTPPSIEDPAAGDLFNLLKIGRRFRALDRKDAFRLLRWLPMPAADLLAEWFESDLLQAVIAARGIAGTFMGPWSAGSGLVLLLQAVSTGNLAGPSAFARGGLGAVTQAIAAAAQHAGAGFRTGADVSQILVRDGVCVGVRLASGEEINTRAVVSGADPQRTFLRLVDPVDLDPDFVTKIRHYRCPGTVAKVNLALSGLPRFAALPDGTGALYGRIHIGPGIDYLERAFDAAKYGQYSPEPYLDVTIPSLTDPSLAPDHQHVMSIQAQFAPYALRQGSWNTAREELANTVIRTLSQYAPNLEGLILHRQVITPHDLEETYSLTGGHIFHGEPGLDQLFTMRPLLGWARYRTPIRGLYLCGAGTHPGIGPLGASGANASREILKDLKRAR